MIDVLSAQSMISVVIPENRRYPSGETARHFMVPDALFLFYDGD